MPLILSQVVSCWNAAKLGGNVLPPLHVVLGNAKDKGGTQVYIKFTYKGEKFHLSCSLGRDGCSQFHITADDGSGMLSHPVGKKAGSTKGVKQNPSYYLNFSVQNTGAGVLVTFEIGDKIYDHKIEKDVKVISAAIDAGLLSASKDIARQFLTYAFQNNGYTPD